MTLSVLLLLCVASGQAISSQSQSPRSLNHPSRTSLYCNATATPACSDGELSYCLEDDEYPLYEIKHAIEADNLFAKKYADVPDQSANELVDHLTKEEEEALDVDFYTGASTGPTPFDITHWSHPDGFVCQSSVVYAMPKRVKNLDGEWRVIVQDKGYFTQTARLETCLFPGAQCRTMAPCNEALCTQKIMHQRLLSYDPCNPYRGLFIDIFRLPSACSCHITEDH